MGASAPVNDLSPTKQVRTSHHRRRKAAIRLLKIALLAVVLWYVGGALYTGIRQIKWHTVEIRWIWIGLSVPLLASARLVLALAQREIYRRAGYQLTVGESIGLITVPQLGKYLPGKVMTVAGHMGIARSFGVPPAVSGSAVILQQALTLATTTTLGLMLLLTRSGQHSQADFVRLTLGGVVLLLLLLALLHPKVYLRLVNLFLRVLKRRPVEMQISLPLMIRLFATAFLYSALGIGGFAVMAAGVIDVPFSSVLMLAGAYCLASVGGFLALFAPAGIGVREGIMLTVIGGFLSPAQAALIVVAARLWAMAMDVLMAGVAVPILHRSRMRRELRSGQ